MQVVKVVKKR